MYGLDKLRPNRSASFHLIVLEGDYLAVELLEKVGTELAADVVSSEAEEYIVCTIDNHWRRRR